MTHSEINKAYKCEFTLDEIADIEKEYSITKMVVCECCREEINDNQIWYSSTGEMCANCDEPLSREKPTFEEFIKIDSESLIQLPCGTK